jgi:type I restriction enzyme S subunit
MSVLDKLLHGVEVEWKTLGEISEIYGGLTGKNKSDFENGNAKYISYKNIFFNLNVNYNNLESVKISETENQHEVKYGDVLFTGSSETVEEVGMSSAVTTNIDETVYLNSFSFGVRFNEEFQLIPDFSKYLFRSKFMRTEISKTASGVTRYNVSKARFKKLQIPIPPLNIQKEIVRILDTFTELTAELTAELIARKMQYNYYREKLLSFDVREVQHLPMGDESIGKFIRGGGLQKKDFTKTGVGCIHYGQIYTYYGTYTDKAKSFVSEEFAKKARMAKHGDLVIATTSETDDDVCKAVAWLGDEEIAISSDACFYTHCLNPKYVTGTKVRRVNADDLAKIKIPVPSPEEQEHIVSILDKFDILTTSISEGLPKEIELRKKQYEYYRDLLLTFPKNNIES